MGTRISRREFVQRSAAAGAALALPGMLAAGAAAAAPKRGGVVNVGFNEVTDDYSPLTAHTYHFVQVIMFALYDPLVFFGAEGKLSPGLAQSWEQPNPKTTIFNLRRGVMFHNGTEMTADDAVYSIDLWHGKKVSGTITPLPPNVYAGVEKLGKYKIAVKTNVPYRTLEAVRRWIVIPKDPSIDYIEAPIGTGPFKFESHTPGSRLDLVRNDSYWARGLPYLDSLNFVFLPDLATRVANMRSGQVNYLHDIQPVDANAVKSIPNTKVFPGGLLFSWWQPQVLSGPLVTAEARRALMFCFDRQKLNQVAWGGRGTGGWNPFDDATPIGIHKPVPVVYDPDRAKSMFEKAGLAGAEVNITAIQGYAIGQLEGQVLQQAFKQAGLKSKVEVVPLSEWQERLYSKRKLQGIIFNTGTLPFPWWKISEYELQPQIQPFPPKYPKIGGGLEKLSKLFDQAQAATRDPQYNRIMKQLQGEMLDQTAVYNSFRSPALQVSVRNLQGVEATDIGDVRWNRAYFS
jgi:peptide/nickel transport system substrate-binding protein